MSNSGLIIGLVFLAVIIGGGYMFRKQIQAFIEKHTGGAGAGGGGEGPPYMPVQNEELLGQLKANPEALYLSKQEAEKSSRALAYSAREINSYT